MNTFTCNVCVDSALLSRRFACPSCGYDVCKRCQKTYMRPSCMNCRAEFTHRHMVMGLGAAYVNTVLRRHQEKILMDHEKTLLPTMAIHGDVDRVREKRENTNLSRFGPVARVTAASAAAAAAAASAAAALSNLRTLRCPAQDCRGYIDTASWTCGLCKRAICRYCHTIVVSDGGHTCNTDDVTSIELMQKDSRSCPQCGVSIFRTEGCNHMHCTYCGTNFNWETCRRIKTTTNHHYNGVSNISDAIAQVAGADAYDEQDQELDIVPRDAVNLTTSDAELTTAIYEDLSVVRFTRSTMFRDALSYEASLAELRVRFLMDEIDEKQWTRRVFALSKSRQRSLHLTHVLDMYIATARDFQRLQFRCASRGEAVTLRGRWISFVCACNHSLASLHDEYGGGMLVLRHRLDDPDQHPLVIHA